MAPWKFLIFIIRFSQGETRSGKSHFQLKEMCSLITETPSEKWFLWNTEISKTDIQASLFCTMAKFESLLGVSVTRPMLITAFSSIFNLDVTLSLVMSPFLGATPCFHHVLTQPPYAKSTFLLWSSITLNFNAFLETCLPWIIFPFKYNQVAWSVNIKPSKMFGIKLDGNEVLKGDLRPK